MHHEYTCNKCMNSMICDKMVYNLEIFFKHVYWHTTLKVTEQPCENGNGDLTTNSNPFKDFKASAGWCNNFIVRNDLGSYIMKG